MLEERAAAGMLPSQGTGIAYAAEERRLQGTAKACLQHIAVGVGGEGARLCGSVGAYVEESPSGSQTAAQRLFVAGEGKQDDALHLVAQLLEPLLHLSNMLVGKSQMGSGLVNGRQEKIKLGWRGFLRRLFRK